MATEKFCRPNRKNGVAVIRSSVRLTRDEMRRRTSKSHLRRPHSHARAIVVTHRLGAFFWRSARPVCVRRGKESFVRFACKRRNSRTHTFATAAVWIASTRLENFVVSPRLRVGCGGRGGRMFSAVRETFRNRCIFSQSLWDYVYLIVAKIIRH